jgi:hypothetical protein
LSLRSGHRQSARHGTSFLAPSSNRHHHRRHIKTQDGARIANALGILRQSLETAQLDAIEQRLAEFERRAPSTRSGQAA